MHWDDPEGWYGDGGGRTWGSRASGLEPGALFTWACMPCGGWDSPRGEAGTSGFPCVSDSDRRVPAELGNSGLKQIPRNASLPAQGKESCGEGSDGSGLDSELRERCLA